MPSKSKTATARPSAEESKDYASKAYVNYTSRTKWEDHQTAYYDNLRKWAEMHGKALVKIPEDTRPGKAEEFVSNADRKINLTFTNIRSLEAKDPALADNERLRLYVDLTNAWIESTDSLTKSEREKLSLAVNSITTFEEAEDVSRRLLAIHMLLNPVVDKSVPGAMHYMNFEEKVINSYSKDDYKGDSYLWWAAHNVLYETWAKDYERRETAPPPPIAPWHAPKESGLADATELEKAKEALAAATKRMESMVQQLEAANEENRKLQSELKTANKENVTRREALEKAAKELDAIKEELKTAKEGLARSAKESKDLSKGLESARQELRKASTDNKLLAARLEEAVAELKLAQAEARRAATPPAKKEKEEGGPEPDYQI